jgi:hypothetical protein
VGIAVFHAFSFATLNEKAPPTILVFAAASAARIGASAMRHCPRRQRSESFSKSLFLTANADTIYVWVNLNLSQGRWWLRRRRCRSAPVTTSGSTVCYKGNLPGRLFRAQSAHDPANGVHAVIPGEQRGTSIASALEGEAALLCTADHKPEWSLLQRDPRRHPRTSLRRCHLRHRIVTLLRLGDIRPNPTKNTVLMFA